MHEYIPVIFSNLHFSYVECFIHTMYVSFKITPSTSNQPLVLKYHDNDKIKTLKLTNINSFEDLTRHCMFSEGSSLKSYYWDRFVKNIGDQILNMVCFIVKIYDNEMNVGKLLTLTDRSQLQHQKLHEFD